MTANITLMPITFVRREEEECFGLEQLLLVGNVGGAHVVPISASSFSASLLGFWSTFAYNPDAHNPDYSRPCTSFRISLQVAVTARYSMTQQQDYRHLRKFTTPLFTSNLLRTAYTSNAYDHFFPSTSPKVFLRVYTKSPGVEITSPKSISIPKMGDGLVEYVSFEPSQEGRNSLLLDYVSGREEGSSSMIFAVGPLALMLRWTHARFGGPQNGDAIPARWRMLILQKHLSGHDTASTWTTLGVWMTRHQDNFGGRTGKNIVLRLHSKWIISRSTSPSHSPPTTAESPEEVKLFSPICGSQRACYIEIIKYCRMNGAGNATMAYYATLHSSPDLISRAFSGPYMCDRSGRNVWYIDSCKWGNTV
ncbi:hypothetical protein EDD85DRAFT_798499 [Armillaria nabsnona]|nr:hypothetical protein EDD85DRAFT_798499 [Armillaria nabsnona]